LASFSAAEGQHVADPQARLRSGLTRLDSDDLQFPRLFRERDAEAALHDLPLGPGLDLSRLHI